MRELKALIFDDTQTVFENAIRNGRFQTTDKRRSNHVSNFEYFCSYYEMGFKYDEFRNMRTREVISVVRR